MIITTLHETTFDYDSPIRGTFTEARLWPISDTFQTCREFSFSVDPMRPLTESQDYYGNMVLAFNILPPHRRVIITGHSIVETHRNPFAPRPAPKEFERHKAQLDFLSFDGPVEDVPELKELADTAGLRTALNTKGMQQTQTLNGMTQTQTLGSDLFAAVQALNTLIYERFTFEANSTHVHTTISEVFAGGKGVCQDFAHIFIAACRAVGLPARYVSGYLVTKRSRSATGSTASHAWVEVLLPGDGWYEFDPTNNILANDYYIKLAVGRDYRDVTPTRGIYNGRGVQSRLGVRVHTIVEDDSISGTWDTARESEAEQELVG